jgi:hypothetical protein
MGILNMFSNSNNRKALVPPVESEVEKGQEVILPAEPSNGRLGSSPLQYEFVKSGGKRRSRKASKKSRKSRKASKKSRKASKKSRKASKKSRKASKKSRKSSRRNKH